MARSTKLDRLITDPLNTRLTTAEAKVATIETRDLVELGDNISGLANDAGYQSGAQVDAKITAVVGAAPAALDTLKEIADKLADDDNAIAALVAQDTANATAIASLQDNLESYQSVQSETNAEAQAVNVSQNTAIAQLVTDVAALENSTVFATNIALDVPYPVGNVSSAVDLLLRNNAIRRLIVDEQLILNPFDAARQNLINSTTNSIPVELPVEPYVGLEFEIINHITSTQNITFAGETVVPGTRHAVQWDGTEWVIL